MRYRQLFKPWWRAQASVQDRAKQKRDDVQEAISLACLQGWWRKGQAGQQVRQVAEDAPDFPVTPGSRGLF